VIQTSAALRRGPCIAAGLLVGYLALAALLFHGAWANPGGRSIGPSGDPQQIMWFLTWLPYAIAHQHNPLFTNWIVYPDGVNIMWNVSMTLPALLLWPVNAMFGPVVTYNAMTTAGVGLSSLVAYFAYQRLVSDRAAAATGALLYGFSPFVTAQSAGHPQMALAIFPPLLLILLEGVLGPRRVRPRTAGALIGATAAGQLLTGEELLFTTALAALLGLAWLAALQRTAATENLIRLIGMVPTMAVTFVLLAGYPLYVQVLGPQVIKGPTHETVTPYSMDLLNPVVPTILTAFDPEPLRDLGRRFAGNSVENTGYLGGVLVLLLVFIVVKWRSRLTVRWAGGFMVAMLVLSMGKHLHVAGYDTGIRLPWALFTKLPFGEHVLAVRLTVFCYLAAGLLVAFGLAQRHELGRRSAALVAVTSLALVPLAPTPDYPATVDPIPAFFTAGARSIPEGSVVYVAPVGLPDLAYTMLWQAVAGMRFRMPTGYAFIPVGGRARLTPPSYLTDQLLAIEDGQVAIPLDVATRARIADELKRSRTSIVVAGPTSNQDAVVARISEIVRRQPRQEGGVYVWEGIDPANVR